MSTTPAKWSAAMPAGDVTSGDLADLRVQAKAACDRILDHAVAQDFAGFDPYDGLAAHLPGTGLIRRSRLGRLALIQAVRRSRVNLRPLLRIPPLVNPKTFGLLMPACCDLYRATGEERYRKLYEMMAGRVLNLGSPGWSGVCWGYPFDWQARAFYLPAGTPTVVCTSFVGRGFLDGYETFGHKDGLEIAWSACRFILHDLARTPGRVGFAFSYSPLDRSVVHNASALGAAHLARVASLTGDESLLAPARAAFDHLIDHQRPDGSWVYGLARHHQWVDTVHTAYVLDALLAAVPAVPGSCVEPIQHRGVQFFHRELLRSHSWPRERTGTASRLVEAHTVATAIFASVRQGLNTEAEGLARAALHNMPPADQYGHRSLFPDGWRQDSRPHFVADSGFLRWSQAWMCRALAALVGSRP